MNELLDVLRHPMVCPIAFLFATGLLAYIFSRWSPLVTKALALVSAVACIWGGIAIVRLPEPETAQFSWTWVTLIPSTSATPGLSLTVDLVRSPLGMILFLGAGAFALLVTIYSVSAMKGTYWEGKFYAYLIWTLAGAATVALAGNLLVLLIGWEIATLMLFLMICEGRGDAPAGGAKAYGMLGFADACLLMAIALLVMTGGTDALSLTRGPVAVGSMGATGYLVYVLILIAALAKAGAVPMHSWIPKAAKDAPAPVTAFLPGSVDKLMGIYLLALLALRMFRPDWTMQVVMMWLGGFTLLTAGLMALMQKSLNRLLAFDAVSQVGYMLLGVGTGTTIGVLGALFHMINHAIYKSNLFLMSGTVVDATGTDDVERMGGLARLLPVTFICGAVGAAAASGIPPFNGFVSKWLVYQGTLELSSRGLATVLLVLGVFGSALTLAIFIKAMYSAFLSAAPKDASYAARPPRESAWRLAPMVVLSAACVFLGLWPRTMVMDVLRPAIENAATVGQDVTAVAGAVETGTLGLWNPTQATGLILIGIVIGLALVWLSSIGKKVRVVRPFLAGEVAGPTEDRWRVPGTHFYETIRKLPLLGPLLGQGEAGELDAYYWSGKHGHSFVEMLRAQHTGLLGLYVAWCLVGLIVTLLYLVLGMGL